MRAYILATERNRFSDILDVLASSKIETIWIDNIDALKSASDTIICPAVLVMANDHFEPTTVSNFVAGMPGKIHIFLISDKVSPTDYRLYSRIEGLEITDWRSAPADMLQFLDKINKFSSNAITTHGYTDKQIVVAFVGAGGGTGNTSIAMEVGIDLSLRSRGGGRRGIAFLDLDLNGGPICDYLNIEPRLDISEIAANPSRLDSYMLEIMTSKHPSGLDIFSSKNQIVKHQNNTSDITILSLLNCVVDNYSITIIDIPNRSPIDTSEIVKNSDFIFLTGIFSVPSAKRLKNDISTLAHMGVQKNKIIILLTDTDTNLLGKISQRFNIDSVFKGYNINYIRRDRSFALECVDSGVSMIQSESKRGICRDIQAIGDIIVNPKA